MAVTTEQLIEVGAKVLHKSSIDPTFRALALSDGSKAVEQLAGVTLPDGMKIRFVDNEGAAFTLGLPPLRAQGELSDRDLESVAGGREVTGEEVGIQIAEFFNGVLR